MVGDCSNSPKRAREPRARVRDGVTCGDRTLRPREGSATPPAAFWHSAPPVQALLAALLLTAAPDDAGLQWRAPEGCPSQADAAEYLHGELNIDPGQGVAEVEVTKADDGWRAAVTIDGAPARALSAASCEDVMAAAMVVIAVTRDAQPEPEPEPEPASDPEPVSVPVPEPQNVEPEAAPAEPTAPAPARSFAAPEPEPAPAAPLRLTHWIGVDAGVAWVHVPAVTARVGARYMLRGRGWALRVGGHYETPRVVLYPGEDVGGRFSAATADVAGCYEPGRDAVSASLCVGPSVGGVFGTGEGIDEPLRPRDVWVGALGRAGLRWAWASHWRLAVDAMVSVSLLRPAFHVGARNPLFRSPRVGGAGLIGIERRLR